MNPKFQKYLDLAYSLYEENSTLRCQHFCIATYKNRIVSIGRNNKKTSPQNFLNPKYSRDGKNISGITGICAEYSCLRRVKQMTNIPFNKITLNIIRVDGNKKIAYSKPCFSCTSLINWVGVKNIYYTNNNGIFEKY